MDSEAKSVAAAATDIVANNTAADIARVKHAISLYANVTSIKFDYSGDEATENPTVLSGTVSVPETATVERFHYDRERVSDFDIANGLWNIMDGKGAK